jgi:hypothetical protein
MRLAAITCRRDNPGGGGRRAQSAVDGALEWRIAQQGEQETDGRLHRQDPQREVTPDREVVIDRGHGLPTDHGIEHRQALSPVNLPDDPGYCAKE